MFCADCRKVYEIIMSDYLKLIQLAGGWVSIVRRIIEIEIKLKIYFEHAHVSTKKIENNGIVNQGTKHGGRMRQIKKGINIEVSKWTHKGK